MKFRTYKNGQTYGPFSIQEIQDALNEHDLVRTDLVWTEGMESWASIESLFDIDLAVEEEIANSPLPPTPESAPAEPEPAEPEPAEPEPAEPEPAEPEPAEPEPAEPEPAEPEPAEPVVELPMKEAAAMAEAIMGEEPGPVAVISVHGVANQKPGETAKQIAGLLLHLDEIENPPDANYPGFEQESLRIATAGISGLKNKKDGESKAGRGEKQPELPAWDHDVRKQLQDYRTEGTRENYHTLCMKGKRQTGPDEDKREQDIHVYEMYWADLSKLGRGLFSVLVAVYRLLFELAWVGKRTLGHDPAKNRYMAVLNGLLGIYTLTLTCWIPLLNVFLLGMLLVMGSAILPALGGDEACRIVITVAAVAAAALGCAVFYTMSSRKTEDEESGERIRIYRWQRVRWAPRFLALLAISAGTGFLTYKLLGKMESAGIELFYALLVWCGVGCVLWVTVVKLIKDRQGKPAIWAAGVITVVLTGLLLGGLLVPVPLPRIISGPGFAMGIGIALLWIVWLGTLTIAALFISLSIGKIVSIKWLGSGDSEGPARISRLVTAITSVTIPTMMTMLLNAGLWWAAVAPLKHVTIFDKLIGKELEGESVQLPDHWAVKILEREIVSISQTPGFFSKVESLQEKITVRREEKKKKRIELQNEIADLEQEIAVLEGRPGPVFDLDDKRKKLRNTQANLEELWKSESFEFSKLGEEFLDETIFPYLEIPFLIVILVLLYSCWCFVPAILSEGAPSQRGQSRDGDASDDENARRARTESARRKEFSRDLGLKLERAFRSLKITQMALFLCIVCVLAGTVARQIRVARLAADYTQATVYDALFLGIHRTGKSLEPDDLSRVQRVMSLGISEKSSGFKPALDKKDQAYQHAKSAASVISGLVTAIYVAIGVFLLLANSSLSRMQIVRPVFDGLRSGMDVALDVINYMRFRPADHNVRSQILSRFASLLRYLGAWRNPERPGEGYRRIVILAHSQGTVITADVLRLLKDEELARANGLGFLLPGQDPNAKPKCSIRLFTMGSPLQQLYARRFPDAYVWADRGGIQSADFLGLEAWWNAYRSGDYVGRCLWQDRNDPCTYVPYDWDSTQCEYREPEETSFPAIREYCIAPGAHTRYWDETAPEIMKDLDRLIAEEIPEPPSNPD